MDLILSASSIKRLVYLILVTGVTFFMAFYLLATSESHWLVWSCLVLSLITIGDTVLTRVAIIFITGLTIAIAVFISGVAASSLVFLSAYLFLLTAFNIFLAQRYPTYALLFFLVSLFAILAAIPVIPLTLNADRTLYILAGAFISGFFQILFAFNFIHDELRICLQRVLTSLARLTDETFSCFLRPEYVDNIYLFERRLHVQKYKFMQAMDKLRNLAKAAEGTMHLAEKETIQQTITRLEQLFDAVIDCSQLRRRVSDHTTFEVCAVELKAISKDIERIFAEMIEMPKNKKRELDTSQLASDIKRFEENYLNVLQVTAREPLVFLLFISSLSGLREALEAFYTNLTTLKKSV